MIKKTFQFLQIKLATPQKRAKIYEKRYGIKMGSDCQVFCNCSFGSEPYLLKFGNKVKITANCSFITHDGGVEVLRNLYEDSIKIDVFGKIEVGNNVFFGNNCIVLPNVLIGDNVVIGAGSIVTKDIPSNSVVCGVPAKVIKNIEDYHIGCLNKSDMTKSLSAIEKKEYLLKKYDL